MILPLSEFMKKHGMSNYDLCLTIGRQDALTAVTKAVKSPTRRLFAEESPPGFVRVFEEREFGTSGPIKKSEFRRVNKKT